MMPVASDIPPPFSAEAKGMKIVVDPFYYGRDEDGLRWEATISTWAGVDRPMAIQNETAPPFFVRPDIRYVESCKLWCWVEDPKVIEHIGECLRLPDIPNEQMLTILFQVYLMQTAQLEKAVVAMQEFRQAQHAMKCATSALTERCTRITKPSSAMWRVKPNRETLPLPSITFGD